MNALVICSFFICLIGIVYMLRRVLDFTLSYSRNWSRRYKFITLFIASTITLIFTAIIGLITYLIFFIIMGGLNILLYLNESRYTMTNFQMFGSPFIFIAAIFIFDFYLGLKDRHWLSKLKGD